MFQGEHINNMDEKGRVSIPATFRDTLEKVYASGDVIVTRDYDGGLRAYAPVAWEKMVAVNVANKDMNDPRTRAFERFVVSAATLCQSDKQGRILLPPTLRTHAALDRRVVFAGMSNYFEIWDEQRWLTVLEKSQLLLLSANG